MHIVAAYYAFYQRRSRGSFYLKMRGQNESKIKNMRVIFKRFFSPYFTRYIACMDGSNVNVLVYILVNIIIWPVIELVELDRA